jgi:cytoskeletal protein CcmA (bactofilin family)
MSTTCPGCHKAIKIEDLVIKSYIPVVDLQTCGSIRIAKRGRVAAQRIQCGDDIVCEGAMEGSIETDGVVHMGPKAFWRGKTLQSRALKIAAGAKLMGVVTVPWARLEPKTPAQEDTAAAPKTVTTTKAAAATASSAKKRAAAKKTAPKKPVTRKKAAAATKPVTKKKTATAAKPLAKKTTKKKAVAAKKTAKKKAVAAKKTAKKKPVAAKKTAKKKAVAAKKTATARKKTPARKKPAARKKIT